MATDVKPVKVWSETDLRNARSYVISKLGKDDGLLRISVSRPDKESPLFRVRMEAYSGQGKRIVSRTGAMDWDSLYPALLLGSEVGPLPRTFGPDSELRMEMKKPIVEARVELERLWQESEDARMAGKSSLKINRLRRKIGKLEEKMRKTLEEKPYLVRIYVFNIRTGMEKEIVDSFFSLPQLVKNEETKKPKRMLRAWER